MKLTPAKNIIGTCLQGTLDISYADLVAAFGPPHGAGDGYKQDAEWAFQTEDGKVFTIYNYKTGKNYNGPDGLDVEDIRDWHVGGRDFAVAMIVNVVLTDYFERNRLLPAPEGN